MPKTKLPVPFFSNTADDTHCFQAVLKMLLKYFFPERDYSWEELDQVSAKAEGLWTWPTAALLWLTTQNIKVKWLLKFSFSKFIEQKEDYLYQFYGSKVASEQIKHSNINQEVRFAEKLLSNHKLKVQSILPTRKDIKSLLDQGYLIVTLIDVGILDNKTRHIGHFVLIYDYDDDYVTGHDPGLPPIKSRKISWSDFERAWSFAKESKSLIALKKK